MLLVYEYEIITNVTMTNNRYRSNKILEMKYGGSSKAGEPWACMRDF